MNKEKAKLSLLFLASIGLSLFISAQANAIGLKEHSIITEDTIKLGDLFYDLPRDENRVLGAAPRPGQDMTINARTLLRIAVALDLKWRPSNINTQVTLRREATVIGYEQISETLNIALQNEGAYGDFEISIPNQYHEIILPIDHPAEMEITRLKFDVARNKFEATIAAPSAQNPIQNFRVLGYIHPVINVPVLRQNVQHGTLITHSDLNYINIREQAFSKDTIADAQKLIGMTARRMLVAGRPIKQSELVAPLAIERGDLLTLSLKMGTMNITTQVKALQNGAKGDVIRVVNLSSNKTLQARVTGTSQATVWQ